MSTLSKIVSSRETVSREITSSIEFHGTKCSVDITAALFRDTPQPNVNIESLFTALKNALQLATSDLTQSDLRLAEEQADDPQVRAVRDSAVTEVKSCISDFRDLFRATYGETVLSTFGLNSEVPANTDLLVTFATNCINLLRTKPLNISAKAGFQPINQISLSDVLSKNVSDLKSALDNVKKEERNYQFALKDRDKKLENWQTIYTSVASIASALFQLGGRKDLAERVRPTTRKQAGITDVTPVTTPQVETQHS